MAQDPQLVGPEFKAFAVGFSLIPEGSSGRGRKKLSDKEHYTDGDKHNVEYDHEVFLGKEQAKTFSELPPEEARRRLG